MHLCKCVLLTIVMNSILLEPQRVNFTIVYWYHIMQAVFKIKFIVDFAMRAFKISMIVRWNDSFGSIACTGDFVLQFQHLLITRLSQFGRRVSVSCKVSVMARSSKGDIEAGITTCFD